MKAGARYVGSVVETMKVESWAARATVRNNNDVATEKVGAQRAAPLPVGITGPRAIGSELVPHRHHQRPRQNRTGEEQAARKPADQAQARVPLFQTDRLISV